MLIFSNYTIKFNLFLLCLTLSLQVFGQTKAHTQKLDSLLNIAYKFYYVDKDSLEFYMEKVRVLAIKENDINNIYEAYIVDSWNASLYGDLERINNNINQLDSLHQILNNEFDKLPNKIERLIQLEYTKGIYFDEIKDTKASQKYFEKVISLSEKTPNRTISEDGLYLIIESYNYLASIFMEEQKYKLAEAYYKRNLRFIAQKSLPERESYSTMMLLAKLYSKKGDYLKSNELLIKHLPFYKKQSGKGNNRVIVSYKELINNYLQLNNLNKSKYYLKLMTEEYTDNHYMLNLLYQIEAKVYESEENYQGALSSLLKNLNFIKNKWEQNPNYETTEAYYLISLLHIKFNNPRAALVNLDLALNNFSKSESNTVVDLTLKLKIIKCKIDALYLLEDFNKVLTQIDSAIKINDALRPSYKTHTDKLFLKEYTFPIFERAISSCYEILSTNSKEAYMEKAFAYFEKSKGLLMLEALLSSKAEKFSNVPEYLLNNDKQLRFKINFLEKKLQKNNDIYLRDELFDLRKKQISLITTIEKNYKPYFNLKYNTVTTSKKNLQNTLDDNTAVVSYFFGDANIFCMTITPTKTIFNQIPLKDGLRKKIYDYKDLLKSPKSSIDDIHKISKSLYNSILQPNLKGIDKEKLVIIPDGILNFIPFETLVNSEGKYLIETTAVSYTLSATLLKQLKSKEAINNNTLGFAPKFKENYSLDASSLKLLPLVHNSKEVNEIAKYFDGQSFVGETASLKNFMDHSNKYGIIHLATHAVLNDKHPDYSYLAFSNVKANEDFKLFASDIYNSSINANMVTLSACETGSGALNKGEGARSLAASFFYSGASSLTSSLWKINDAASTKIMGYYYKNLHKGQQKDLALKNAKLEYIKLNNDTKLSHPYYWSGFVVSGNTAALVDSNNWFYIVFAVLMLTAIIIYKKNKK